MSCTCEIRVSANDITESYFSLENGLLDIAGAVVAIAGRKAIEGKIARSMDRYDVFNKMLDWFDNCPSWEFLPHMGHYPDSYYHIEIDNDRQGNLSIEIGYSFFGQPVKYCNVNEFIKLVNEARKDINRIYARHLPGIDSPNKKPMLKLAQS